MRSCCRQFKAKLSGLLYNFARNILRYFGYSIRKSERYPKLPKCSSSSTDRTLDVSGVVRRQPPRGQVLVAKRSSPRILQDSAEIIELRHADSRTEPQYWLHFTHPGLLPQYHRLSRETAQQYLADADSRLPDNSGAVSENLFVSDGEEISPQRTHFSEPDGDPEVLDCD